MSPSSSLVILLAFAPASPPKTPRDPRIVAVRNIYRAIQGERPKLRKKTAEFNCVDEPPPYTPIHTAMYVDKKGRAKILITSMGSEDSMVTLEQYYDRNRLRFVLLQGGAVNGTAIEQRIWFDHRGRRLLEKRTHLEGPGYTFPYEWPSALLVLKNPKQAFLRAQKCPPPKN